MCCYQYHLISKFSHILVLTEGAVYNPYGTFRSTYRPPKTYSHRLMEGEGGRLTLPHLKLHHMHTAFTCSTVCTLHWKMRVTTAHNMYVFHTFDRSASILKFFCLLLEVAHVLHSWEQWLCPLHVHHTPTSRHGTSSAGWTLLAHVAVPITGFRKECRNLRLQTPSSALAAKLEEAQTRRAVNFPLFPNLIGVKILCLPRTSKNQAKKNKRPRGNL